MAKYTHFHILSWDNVAIGGMLSGMALFMGVFGQYTGGVLAERAHLKRNIFIMGAVSFPFLLCMAIMKDFILLFMALFFFYFNFAIQPMVNTLVARFTTLEMRATAYGIFFFAAFGLGSMAASFSGFIAQNFGLPWVFVGLSGASLLLCLTSFLLIRVKNPLKALGHGSAEE
jgi:MFS family permease